MTSVGICTPFGGDFSFVVDYYRYCLTVQNTFPQHQFQYIQIDMTIVGKARNSLVEAAQSAGVDLLWWIDADVGVPPHAGNLLEQAMDLGVVSGVYYSRRPPYTPQVYKLANEKEYFGMYWPDLDLPTTGMVTRDAVGAGCLAVRSEVFTRLTENWEPRVTQCSKLLEDVDPAIARIVKQLSPHFEFLNRKGEDMYFCERLVEIGQPIWVNCDVQCVHNAMIPIGREQFQYLHDNNLIQREKTEVNQ